MKGLILSGGVGTRLRPLTHSGAKQLVPIANRPILFFVVDRLVEAGISDIGVVVSPETGDEVRQALGDGSAFGASFSFVCQPRPLGIAHAVLVAHDYLGDSDFALCLGDNLVGSSIAADVAAFRQGAREAMVLLKEVDDPRAFGVAELAADGQIARLLEKPREPASNLALVGIYLLRKSIFEAIARIHPSDRGELEITDALSALLQADHQIAHRILEDWWLDTGKKDDLLRANDTILDHWLEPRRFGHVDVASELVGTVHVGRGAQVQRSKIVGPAVIGDDVVLSDARIGPYTSIGDRCQVSRSYIEHCVLMNDSRVIDVPGLRDSLIGRRVVVTNSSCSHVCLSVGDDCFVEVPTC